MEKKYQNGLTDKVPDGNHSLNRNVYFWHRLCKYKRQKTTTTTKTNKTTTAKLEKKRTKKLIRYTFIKSKKAI